MKSKDSSQDAQAVRAEIMAKVEFDGRSPISQVRSEDSRYILRCCVRRVLIEALSILLLLSNSTSSIAQTRGEDGGEKRVALVIGNSQYVSAPLRNPVNDARAMATAL